MFCSSAVVALPMPAKCFDRLAAALARLVEDDILADESTENDHLGEAN